MVLLALFLHAALAGATHLHRIGPGPRPSAPGITAGPGEETNAALETAGHAQCLLCRLQRDLAAGLVNAGPATAEPPPAIPRFDAAPLGARHETFHGLTQGRAPPLA